MESKIETYEEILGRMEEVYREESGCAPEDVSDAGLRLRALAGELYRLRAGIAWLERQAFPQTAQGKELDLHGVQRGILRRESLRAEGKVTLSRYLPLSFDLVVPAGTLCASSGNEEVQEYETTADAVLPTGNLTVDVPARAVLGGAAGNAAAGYITTLVTPPVGINFVTNKQPFTGGLDRETDSSFRARILSAALSMPSGANTGYYKQLALRHEGVGSAGAVPKENGPGTVGVYIWGKGGPPTENTVREVAEAMESARDVGVTVTVAAAKPYVVNLYPYIKVKEGVDFARAKEDAEEAIRRFFAGLEMGDTMYLTDISRTVMNAAPVTKLEYAMGAIDVAPLNNEILTLGTVEVRKRT